MNPIEYFWGKLNLYDPNLKGSKGIFKIHGDICSYCGIFLRAKGRTVPKRFHRTKDHVIPKSAGGGIMDDNLVPACYSCNNRKGALTPIAWLWKIKRNPDTAAARTIGIDRRPIEYRTVKVHFVDKNGIPNRKSVYKPCASRTRYAR